VTWPAPAAITYPSGDTTASSTVVHVASAGDGRTAVILDVTAFHPIDTAWPDQPADRGVLRTGRAEVEIVDGVVAAWHDDALLLGRDVPVRTGTDGWLFAVAHIVEGDPVAVGDTVVVEADPAHRSALSAGHTACHLASLALDVALADAWRKEVPVDALGSPGFDALAIQESRIVPNGSRDVYRIGKSLRRKGFDPAALDDLTSLEARVDLLLASWVAGGGAAHIETAGPALADRRTWVCTLPDAEVRIPCGGTHVSALSEFAAITVAFETEAVEGGLVLVMTTTATRR
jgi:alanyl-tRNA synthetase